jgi:putative transposase
VDPLPRRKHPRLAIDSYALPGSMCSVTFATRDRQLVFADHVIARAAVGVLQGQSHALDVRVFGYCLMPDHVHLVISPSASCDVIAFVARVKNLIQREAWRLGVQGAIWQNSFWDHLLRADEQVELVVGYVLRNPVRRGLVDDWRETPFCGSFVLELD